MKKYPHPIETGHETLPADIHLVVTDKQARQLAAIAKGCSVDKKRELLTTIRLEYQATGVNAAIVASATDSYVLLTRRIQCSREESSIEKTNDLIKPNRTLGAVNIIGKSFASAIVAALKDKSPRGAIEIVVTGRDVVISGAGTSTTLRHLDQTAVNWHALIPHTIQPTTGSLGQYAVKPQFLARVISGISTKATDYTDDPLHFTPGNENTNTVHKNGQANTVHKNGRVNGGFLKPTFWYTLENGMIGFLALVMPIRFDYPDADMFKTSKADYHERLDINA